MKDLESSKQSAVITAYPYSSKLAATMLQRRERGEKIDEWITPGFDLKTTIEHIDGPIIELAGPTEIGHYYLNDVRLPGLLIISNISRGNLSDRSGKKDTQSRLLDRLLDVQHLDLPDNSVGMVIAAHLPVIDEEDFDFSNFDDEMNAEYLRRQHIAEQAIEDVAKSGNLTEPSIKQSLRLTAAQEIHRCLKPGGIYLADGTTAEKAALQRLGYKIVAAIRGNSNNEPPYYYMALQKI